ncbi:MAG TPA: hypothetical protein IAC12_04845 [Candidatus Aphodovivens avistercoris]|nr:hypothetical protein [Candidatus Aphodovivens avistercoris]
MSESTQETKLTPMTPSKVEITQQIAGEIVRLAPADIDIDLAPAVKVPLDQIASLGTGFASIPERFRTITMQNSGTLMEAFDKSGRQLNLSELQKFNNGSGSLGSLRDATGFHQARLREAPGAPFTAPINPATIAMAVALSQINQKLDTIQQTQQEMFDYLKQQDKAKLRADLQTLVDMMDGYRFNWENSTFRQNKHAKALDIRQDAEQSIIHLRAQIKTRLAEKSPIANRFEISRRLNEVLDRLKEYQLSLYLYAFAAFAEVMMLGNFDEDYLKAIANKIEERSLQYRQVYTECYNIIESSSEKALDSTVLGGLSIAGKTLGGFIKNTPLGNLTPIDEALEGAGESIGSFNESQTEKLLEKLRLAKTPEVKAFSDSLASVNVIYNKPTRILADSENVYMLPLEQSA